MHNTIHFVHAFGTKIEKVDTHMKSYSDIFVYIYKMHEICKNNGCLVYAWFISAIKFELLMSDNK